MNDRYIKPVDQWKRLLIQLSPTKNENLALPAEALAKEGLPLVALCVGGGASSKK